MDDFDENFFICIHDIDSTYLYVNEKCCEYTGYLPGELVGKSPYDLIHPADKKEILINSHAEIFNQKQIYLDGYRIIGKKNKIVWLKSMISALKTDSGRLRYFVSLNKHMTVHAAQEPDFPVTFQQVEEYANALHKRGFISISELHDLFIPLNGQLIFSQNITNHSVHLISGRKYLFGYGQADIAKAGFPEETIHEETIHEEDRQQVKSIIQKTIELYKKEPVPFKNQLSIIYRVKRPNGDCVHILRQMTQYEVDTQYNLVSCLNVCNDASFLRPASHVCYDLSGPGEIKNQFNHFCKSDRLELSRRELEILKLIYAGQSSGEISKALNIAKNTVNTHRRNMLKKTRVKNSVDLIKYAIHRNLLQ